MKHHCQIFYRGPTENSLVAVSQLLRTLECRSKR